MAWFHSKKKKETVARLKKELIALYEARHSEDDERRLIADILIEILDNV